MAGIRTRAEKMTPMLSPLIKILPVCLAVMCFVQGCQQFTPPPREIHPRALSGTTLSSSPLMVTGSSGWWTQFNSNELTGLVETALAENFSLREAAARLDQAKSQNASTRAGLFPTITLNGDYTRTQTDRNTTSFNTFVMGPAASYEVDFWGRIKADVAASHQETLASGYDLGTAAMSVAAEVANTWVSLIATRKQLKLLKQQLEVNTTVLDLLELRFEKSMSTALDVLQQREVVARAQAEIPPIENQAASLENTLALLIGRTPDQCPRVLEDLPEQLPPLPVNGLPANLLALRPDVRAAGSRLVAADWDKIRAGVDRLPDFSITGSFLFRETSLNILLQNWILSLGAGLSATVFDGGKKEAALATATAVVKERLATYEKTVLTAILEVDNSLAAEHHQARYVDLLLVELATAHQALEEARRRYIKGLDPFIPFLTEQLNVQKLESRLIEQKALLIKDRIALYRALGGDWTQQLEMP